MCDYHNTPSVHMFLLSIVSTIGKVVHLYYYYYLVPDYFFFADRSLGKICEERVMGKSFRFKFSFRRENSSRKNPGTLFSFSY